MKTNLLPTRIESGAPAFESGPGRVPTFALAWLALGIGTSTNGCGFDPTCAETATCQPSDAGADDAPGDRAGTFEQRNAADGLGSSDIRSDTEPDRGTSGPSDARSDDTRVDAPFDGPTRDTIDATRADVSTDSSIDVKSGDAGDSSAADGGIVNVDAAPSDTSNDPGPGIDSSNDVSVDGGGSADVVVGCNPTTCPSGCCDTNNQCVTTPSIDACGGWGGGKCQACSSGQECNGTSCVCSANSCTTGCCDSTNHCVPFASQSDTQCGAGGACTSCSATMQKCDTSNGQCVCNAASCPTGCCDSSKHCVPYSGQSDTQCGAGGLACSACTSDKFCNASGGCDVKNWCRTQTIPAGVASGDYQCLDFDSGMPPSNVWVPTVQSFGILELATDQVQSVPNALHARSVPTGGMTPAIPESIGQLAWGVSGALVSAVSITTDIYPLQLQGGAASRSDYLCLKIGALKGCLAYFDPNALGALSLVFPEGTSGPGTGYPVCDIGPTLDAPAAAWTRITLRLSSAGLLSLTIGTKTVPCSANLTVSSGVTAVQLGAHGVIEGDNYGDAHFDNVVTYVER